MIRLITFGWYLNEPCVEEQLFLAAYSVPYYDLNQPVSQMFLGSFHVFEAFFIFPSEAIHHIRELPQNKWVRLWLTIWIYRRFGVQSNVTAGNLKSFHEFNPNLETTSMNLAGDLLRDLHESR